MELVRYDQRPLLGHCCATVALHHISATMTYMLWHEEHLWNASVLQRVQISNLI
jgi:hypothetical protein